VALRARIRRAGDGRSGRRGPGVSPALRRSLWAGSTPACFQLSTLERVCESLDVPMWDVIREAERAEYG
jgi:DNA-binding Xre family transcriptional regulator